MGILENVTRNITTGQLARLEKYLTDPNYTFDHRTVKYIRSGSKYRDIIYKSKESSVTLVVIPTDNARLSIDFDSAVCVESYGILQDSNKDQAAKIPKDQFEQEDIFPELRQAFHEGLSYQDRDADFKYHFSDGDTGIAVPSSDPVERLENEINITAVECIGGHFPQRWLLDTRESGYMFLRERSGQIRLYDQLLGGDEIFNAYIGREHPGTRLSNGEVINIVTAVNYINIEDEYDETVDDEAHDIYFSEPIVDVDETDTNRLDDVDLFED